MKTIRYMLITLAAILGLTALAACTQPVTPSRETTGRVILSVSAGAPGAARTVLPTGTPEFSKYDLDFNNGAITSFTNVTPAQLAQGLELTAGTWTVTVKAYRKFTETEYLAAQGTSASSFSVGAGELVPVTVALTPVPMTDTSVQGIFTYKVSFPADVTSAYLSFGNEPPVTLTSGQWVSVELTPGQYDLSIFVQKGPLSAGTAEKVHVYSGLESKAEFTFEDEDFVRPAPLSADTWKNGAFTAYAQTAWYSFPADAGTPYALEWEGYSNNSTAYTGYVGISAYDSMMQIWYGNPGDSPISLSVSSNDTIYVRVQAYNSGTYRIKYYDASAMPPLTAPDLQIGVPAYTVRWNDVGGTDTYQVSRSTSETGSYDDIGSPVSDDNSYWYSFTDSTAAPGTTYWYKVRAVNANGNGPDSAALEVSPPTALTDGAWAAGNLTASAWTALYTFDAAIGVSYTLEWEDLSNSTYTGGVSVTAYRSDGNSLGSGFPGDSPLSLSVGSADTIYVRVQAFGPLGTYRIKYY